LSRNGEIARFISRSLATPMILILRFWLLIEFEFLRTDTKHGLASEGASHRISKSATVVPRRGPVGG
jgi:hypothetical protein